MIQTDNSPKPFFKFLLAFNHDKCFAHGQELLVFFLGGILGKGDAVENKALEKLTEFAVIWYLLPDTRKGYFTELFKKSDIQVIL